MTQTKKDNKYAIIAAICFILIAINNFVNGIDPRLLSIISIGFALSLFLRKPIAATVVCVIEILYRLYLYIGIGFTVYYFVYLLAYIAIFVMLILLFKNNKVVNKIWFLGAILMFIAGIIRWRKLFLFLPDLYFTYHSYIALGSQLLEVVALLFIGLWIKDFKYEKKQTCKSVNTESSLGTADKLELYYGLLQSGAITQEEYDAKKKQLLGL